MLNEWPLILFTTLGQTGAGLALFAGLQSLTATDDEALAVKPGLQFLLAALLMGAGFGFAAMHLGSPGRMFNSMAQLGSSALSQEGLAGMLTAILCGVAGVSGLKGRVNKALAGTAAVACLVFVYTMARIYASMTTVPTWSTPLTPVSFFGAALFAGGALFGATAKADIPGLPMATLGMILGGLMLLVSIPLQAQSALELVNEPAVLNCLGACSAVLLGLALAGGMLGNARPRVRIPAFLLGLGGVLLARTLFYGLHTTLIMH